MRVDVRIKGKNTVDSSQMRGSVENKGINTVDWG